MSQTDRSITRRRFIGTTLAGAAAAASIGASRTASAQRPNIFFIFADDLGAADISCYGRPDYKTPNIDRLATQGMRFSNGYAAAPVCTPTRVGWATGRYPARLPVGLEEPIKDRGVLGDKIKTIGIPLAHPTLSSLLKAAGYETALIGKWHLGYLPVFGPLKFGFDEYFGIMGGAADYFAHTDLLGEPDLFEGEVPVERTGYLTDLLTDRAVDLLKKAHKKPFYLSLHYNAPHWPWEGPKDLAFSKTLGRGYDALTSGGSLKTYAEIMRSLDDGVGKVLETLRKTGLERNTLVVFTSDNGGERFSYNWPFRGEKFDVYEGGVRVPAIVRWPGVVAPGSRSDQPVITMDWTATFLAAAGTGPHPDFPLDGDDLRQTLSGKRAVYDRTFFWRTYRQGGMRSGQWKYIRDTREEFLYDLSVDAREQADFKTAQPQVLTRLRNEFSKWEAQMVPYPKDQQPRH